MTALSLRFARPALAAVIALAACTGAQAQEKFVYLTNWYAQAEHGGFYQALATGLYKKAGLDVTLKMGGPQVNTLQIMGAGQADCVMGSSDVQMVLGRQNGLPVVTVAASFQKDPQALLAHEDVKSMEDMKSKTLLIASSARQGYWPWVKMKYGLKDEQTRPYTFNVQPFVADKNAVMQGYITSEPFALEKAGVKANAFLLADLGYPTMSTTISCLDKTVKERKPVLAAFVKATMEGWKSYFADPSPANVLIKKDNPNMSDEQLAYSLAKMKEYGLVTGGEAGKLGIGGFSDARAAASWEFMVAAKLVDPTKVKLSDTYTTEFIKDLKVLP